MEKSLEEKMNDLLQSYSSKIASLLSFTKYDDFEKRSLTEQFQAEVNKGEISKALSLLSKIFLSEPIECLTAFHPFLTYILSSKRRTDLFPYLELILTACLNLIGLQELIDFDSEAAEKQKIILFNEFYLEIDRMLQVQEKNEKCFGLCRFLWEKDPGEYGFIKRMELSLESLPKAKKTIDEKFLECIRNLKYPEGLTYRPILEKEAEKGISNSKKIKKVLKLLEVLRQLNSKTDEAEKDSDEGTKKEKQDLFDFWLMSKEEAQAKGNKNANLLLKQNDLEIEKKKEKADKKLQKQKNIKQKKDEVAHKREKEKRGPQQVPERIEPQNEAQNKSSIKEEKGEDDNVSISQVSEPEPKGKNISSFDDNKAMFESFQQFPESWINALCERINEKFKQDYESKIQDHENKIRDLESKILEEKNKDYQSQITSLVTIISCQDSKLKATMETKFLQIYEAQEKLLKDNTESLETAIKGTIQQSTKSEFDSLNKLHTDNTANSEERKKQYDVLIKRLKTYVRLPLIRTWCRGFLLKCKEKYKIGDEYTSPLELQTAIENAAKGRSKTEGIIITQALKYCESLVFDISEFVHQVFPETTNLVFDIAGSLEMKDTFILEDFIQFFSPLKDQEFLAKHNIIVNKELTNKLKEAYFFVMNIKDPLTEEKSIVSNIKDLMTSGKESKLSQKSKSVDIKAKDKHIRELIEITRMYDEKLKKITWKRIRKEKNFESLLNLDS